MAATIAEEKTDWTVADILDRFGPIAVGRIRLDPAPGQATHRDVAQIHEREKRLFELVDCVLVEKVMGFRESILAAVIIELLRSFPLTRQLGTVTAPDGMMRLAAGLVRIPDVSFISWDKFPDRRVPDDPVPLLVPDLAVEILSKGNTDQEMARKLVDYFGAGVRLVWFVDANDRTIRVFSSPGQWRIYREGETVDGGDVLPGFELSLEGLFAELDKK